MVAKGLTCPGSLPAPAKARPPSAAELQEKPNHGISEVLKRFINACPALSSWMCIRLLLDSEFSPFEVFTSRLTFFSRKFSLSPLLEEPYGASHCKAAALALSLRPAYEFPQILLFFLSKIFSPSSEQPLLTAPQEPPFSSDSRPASLGILATPLSSASESPSLGAGALEMRALDHTEHRRFLSHGPWETFRPLRLCPLPTDKPRSLGNKLPALSRERRPNGG